MPLVDNPYIGGFDYARPDRPEELSGPAKTFIAAERNVYRHHDVQDEPVQQSVGQESKDTNPWTVANTSEAAKPVTRYQKIHDIYSLGVILYEIGIWRRAMEKYISHRDPGNFKDNLIESCSDLGPLMGTRYERVVRRCLNGDFGVPYIKDETKDDGKLQKSFWSKVIVELNECHV